MAKQHFQFRLLVRGALINLVSADTRFVQFCKRVLILLKLDQSKTYTQVIKMAALRISILSLIVFFSSCGVNKDEYDKVVSENTQLKKEIAELKERLDLSQTKANISKLKVLFDEYNTGAIDHLVRQIEELDPQNNLNKFSDIYGDMAGQIVHILLDIIKLNQSYQIEIIDFKKKLESIENSIQTTKNEIEKLNNEDYQYVSLIIVRRFDTDAYTGKGYYEAVNVNSHRKVVIIATEKEAKTTYQGARKRFLVKSLGEKATTVRQSTTYRSDQVTEYYEYFVTVDESKNPFKKKEELSDLEKAYSELEKEFSIRKKTLLDKIEKDTKIQINRIFGKM